MHCDALTKEGGAVHVTKETLAKGGCLLQCFAAFISEREDRFARALALCDRFGEMCAENGYRPVRRFKDIGKEEINAMLTVEEGGACEGDPAKLEELFRRGVRLMTLLWNRENEIGYPNFPDYEGLLRGQGSPEARERRGLKPLGEEIVCRMQQLGMIVDVSHASDGVFSDVARMSKEAGIPFVASHSGAAAVCPWARNLTDEQIAVLGDCGGVVGLDFCSDFLGGEPTPEGQREAVLAHAEHILAAGGEDVLAIGSDFDGIPTNPYIGTAADMPRLFSDFTEKFGARIAEKIFLSNARRVLGEVL